MNKIDENGLCVACGDPAKLCGCDDRFLDDRCGYSPDEGVCTLAGSEECERDCPLGRLVPAVETGL